MARKKLTQDNLNALVAEALAIEAEAAKEAGAVGYMARALTQATMPHKRTEGNEFTRTNGAFTLSIMAPARFGLPYGSIPRLLVSWLTTEAVRTKDRQLVLGDSMAHFMGQLGLHRTGGPRGDINRLREQCRRLFASTVTCVYSDDDKDAIKHITVADNALLWWNPKHPEQAGLWESTVTLTQAFFDEVTANPVPVDMRALAALRQSPMALDIYCWLTHRMSYLSRPTVIPWPALQMQFGAEYGRLLDFKKAFLGHLRAVGVVYPEARLEPQTGGLLLLPSAPHVAKLR